jgi:hypothetical protein
MQRLVTLASVVVLAASLAPSALAQQGNGKGKGKGSGENSSGAFTLAMVTDYNANNLPNWGDQVTFQISTTETTEPRVQVMCFQNGDVVYGALWQPSVSVLTLSSRAWVGGAADCSATLYYIRDNKIVNLESMHFTVDE